MFSLIADTPSLMMMVATKFCTVQLKGSIAEGSPNRPGEFQQVELVLSFAQRGLPARETPVSRGDCIRKPLLGLRSRHGDTVD
jgi:hypothetical protein